MAPSRPGAILFGSVLLLAATASSAQSAEQTLVPGQARECSIAGGAAHVYRTQVTDLPLLVTVDQKGINLTAEAQGPADRLAGDTGEVRWGPEVLLLESPGEYRIEVRPRETSAGPGCYTIQVQTLPVSPDGRRDLAFALLSRAGQEAFARTPDAWRQAVGTYRKALGVWRSLGDRRWEAETLSALAALEHDVSDLRPAEEDHVRALALWRELEEPHREAATLNLLGVTRLDAGEIAGAREAFQSALSSWQSLGERYDEGETRSNLCGLEAKSGALPAALDCLKGSLALFRDLGDQSQEARILNWIGGIDDLLGEPDDALDSYQKALTLQRQLGDRQEEARTLNNIAVVHRALGEWQEALRVYDQVREILEPIGDRSLEAARLNNIGFTYTNMGEPQRALPFLEDALAIRRKIGDRPSEVVILNNRALAWRGLGDPDKALDDHRQALKLATALGDRGLETLSRLGLAEVQLDQGDAASALRELEPALVVLRERGNRRKEAQTLQLKGRALAAIGRPQEALPVLQDVLARCRDLRDGAGEAEALQTLAAVERSTGRTREARAHADAAVARVEELRRTGFVSPALRAAFLATQRRAYSLLIDLLMDQHAAEPQGGYDRAALEVSERARARSLLDVLSSGSAGHDGSAAPELRERRQSLRRRLSAKADQQLKPGAKAEALGREIEALLAELDGVEANIRRLDPHYAAVSEPRTLGVEDVAKLLDPGTFLLEYSLGEEHSYLWEIGAGSFHSFVLPSQQKIETLARQVYGELSTYEAGTGGRGSAAEELSQTLLGPVWSEVADGRRLVVVPDAALHLLPFGALPAPDSGRRLLGQLEIAYLPSATTLALQRQRLEQRAQASHWAAVIADPVFTADDPRLPHPSGAPPAKAPTNAPLANLERLSATGREAQEIAKLAPAGQVLTALDLDASRDVVLSGKLRDYRVVHFGTHGLADTRNPELSGLVFSLVDAAGRPQEGFLSLSDIYELDLGADLVVLSGCRTALGKEVRGEGIMGLTRGFLYAGVPRVVASLWRVEDHTTAELMTRFYRALWQDHLPAAAALRQAQLSLKGIPRYSDPYSWAGFVLQGDWR
ncbi:MAG TPA: CHAT domain-containing tetratricopeptide repeat protein [Thermoanaerobaculia bacterium]|nr:CHAT domain-containing tetratricopeptide repeat protein [Thermoanaerobaculia bacterium]